MCKLITWELRRERDNISGLKMNGLEMLRQQYSSTQVKAEFFAADRIHQICENYYTLCVVGGELETVPLLMQIILTPA